VNFLIWRQPSMSEVFDGGRRRRSRRRPGWLHRRNSRRAARCKGRVHRACAELGGTCLRIGCIPTKAWVQTAFTVKQAEETFEKLGVRFDGLHLEFAKVNAWKAAVVKQMTQGVAFLFKTNSVEWIKETGTFKDANTIGVEGSEDVSFKSAIIATGSFPLRTPIQRLESDCCVDSEGLLAQT
jgi:dihydrolipoamide dehydrogenase